MNVAVHHGRPVGRPYNNCVARIFAQNAWIFIYPVIRLVIADLNPAMLERMDWGSGLRLYGSLLDLLVFGKSLYPSTTLIFLLIPFRFR